MLSKIKNKLSKIPLPAWYQAMLIKRQEQYVTELRDEIVVLKRGLSHIQRVHEEQNRKLIKMQMKLS